jgi:hypothetical protein
VFRSINLPDKFNQDMHYNWEKEIACNCHWLENTKHHHERCDNIYWRQVLKVFTGGSPEQKPKQIKHEERKYKATIQIKWQYIS